MQGTCGELVGVILLVNAVITTIVSIATPYWAVASDGHVGLLATCNDECVWHFENDFSLQQGLPGWFKATQGLMCAGFVLGLIALLTAISSLCCACHSCRVHRPIYWFLITTCIAIAAGITTFGVKAHEEWNLDLNGGFGWSMWVGAGAAALALLSSILYCCVDCHRRRRNAIA